MAVRRLIWIALLAILLAGCDTLAPEPPTAPPTWEFTGATLAPTPTVLNLPPTEVPLNFGQPGLNNPEAAALPPQSDMPPLALDGGQPGVVGRTVQIALGEGQFLTGRLFENPPLILEQGEILSRLPGVLLVGASLDGWGDFPERLRDAGFTVMAVDFSPAANVNAFTTALHVFSQSQTVNPGLMGTIGTGQGASLALLGCAADPLCDAAALIGPTDAETLFAGLPGYNPRPLFSAASRDDATAFETAQALAQAVGAGADLHTYEGGASGLQLLAGQPELVDLLAAWFAEALVD